ncbi:hypothetical protein HPP92_019161 [Vanilla planifolia]|uniref:Reverse transcriptase zinc-binding domain-containing protein n=1 Tax=Vanilla planifolia TaxID=51239 RepID=A0A835QB88_VANPL|nr:hypothetical protein HPP92_019161 [Vanilla planifolia]
MVAHSSTWKPRGPKYMGNCMLGPRKWDRDSIACWANPLLEDRVMHLSCGYNCGNDEFLQVHTESPKVSSIKFYRALIALRGVDNARFNPPLGDLAWIWKLKVLPRVHTFLWRVARNLVPLTRIGSKKAFICL